MPLIIHSNSTKKYAQQIAKEYKKPQLINIKTIKKPMPQKDPIVIGIGGGKVLDYAKVIAGENPATLIPTTASGAAATDHAVYWNPETKRKEDIPTKQPKIIIQSKFLENLPETILKQTSYDALAHSLDSYWSKKATQKSKQLSKQAHKKIIKQIKNNYQNKTELIKAGNIAGQAINITETNMTHAISYPLTAIYNIPHGKALGWLIPLCAEYQECELEIPNIDIKLENIKINKKFIQTVTNEAMTYKKIHDAKKDITKKELKKLLEKKT